ncbi:MAG: hypothetical protein IKA36_05335, partial [Clostridia bacterium]|nr:hypothetical protein [Clostridia bacterium]
MNDRLSSFIAEAISFVTLLLVAIFIYYAVTYLIKKTLNVIIEKSPSKRDDLFLKNKVFRRLCLLIPAYLIRYNIEAALPSYPIVT